MKSGLTIGRKLFLSHFLAILCITGSVTAIFYWYACENVEHQLKTRLQSTAAILGCDFDGQDLESIQGEADMIREEYARTLAKLRTYKAANSDIAFLYIMRRVDDKVVFVVDSDASDEQAPPGYHYEEANAEMFEGFAAPSVDREMFEDEWGVFMSGYAPIVNGDGRYLIGVDMQDQEVAKQLDGIRRGVGVAILMAVVLSFLLGQTMAAHFKRPIAALVEQVEAIRSGDLERKVQLRSGDEMDTLISAMNRMSGDLKLSQKENLKAAESLRDSLGVESANRED